MIDWLKFIGDCFFCLGLLAMAGLMFAFDPDITR